MSEFQDCVRSHTPGRTRLRHPMVKSLSLDDQATARQWIESIDGVFNVEFNPLVGSVLILWDTNKLTGEDFLRRLEDLMMMAASMFASPDGEAKAEPTLLNKVTQGVGYGVDRVAQGASRGVGTLATYIAGDAKDGKHSIQRVQRMALNRTMLAALTVSLAGLATRNMGVHGIAGVAFLGFLGLHLWGNRRLL